MPQHALRILPGETLCISGRVDESGTLVDLRLVEESAPGAETIMLRLERGEETTLDPPLLRQASPC